MWGDVGPRSPPPARPPQQTPPHPGRFLQFPWGAASRRYRLCRGAGTRPAASGAGGERIAAPASAEACARVRVCVCGRSLWASELAPARPPPLQGEAAAAPGTAGGSWHSRGAFDSPSLRRLGQQSPASDPDPGTLGAGFRVATALVGEAAAAPCTQLLGAE